MENQANRDVSTQLVSSSGWLEIGNMVMNISINVHNKVYLFVRVDHPVSENISKCARREKPHPI